MEKNIDISGIRAQFPIFRDSSLVYLDSAATAQKPQCVIDAENNFYENENASVKRGMYKLAERATEEFESAREKVKSFIGAKSDHEIIFTKSATESINLVARCQGEKFLKKGDTVLLSILEHHSNIVPWMQLKERIGINIEWVHLKNGELDIEELKSKIAEFNPKLVTITCASNVTGILTPYKEIISLAHSAGAKILLDAAQLVPHRGINVQDIDCDFLVFSGHKVYGPTGIGVLYGKEKLLEDMPAFLGGGSMIQEVTEEGFLETHLPDKFEAGTPPIAQAIGLGAAIDWISDIGWKAIEKHEEELRKYAFDKLSEIEFVEILPFDAVYPEQSRRTQDDMHIGCVSFITKEIHPHDLTEYLGSKGICLRAGHHCAQPLHKYLGHTASTRMSLGIYNSKEDIDKMCEAIAEAYEFFLGKSYK
jgi:cysteine desulfurase / selenocysteine lyase